LTARNHRLVPRLKILTVVTLACLALFGFVAQAHANNGSIGLSSQRSASSTSAHQASAPWVSTTNALNGRAIHFIQMETSYIQGSHNLADGRTVRGDIWELISPAGQLLAFHGVYTSPDGKTFYQEIFENASVNTVIIGKATPGLSSTWMTMHHCLLQLKPSLNSSLLPSFADSAKLGTEGFQHTTGTLLQPSLNSATLSNVSPALTLNGSQSVQIWTKTTTRAASTIQTQQITVDSQGRVRVASNALHRNGTLISSDQTTFSTLYAYNPSQIPASIFAQPQTSGGCTR
jgi:hypothetical protein